MASTGFGTVLSCVWPRSLVKGFSLFYFADLVRGVEIVKEDASTSNYKRFWLLGYIGCREIVLDRYTLEIFATRDMCTAVTLCTLKIVCTRDKRARL